MAHGAGFDVHVVSHTHWDREWYHTAERFRQRLVALVDELLDFPPASGGAFLLDGQAIVLDDYLAVRPDRALAMAERLRAGTLEAGPWYVLADELIPSGEALVRNLLAGRAALRRLSAEPPPVLYCPDSFGHPAALPLLARGFGCELIVLWRGLGGARWPCSDVFRWRAPDGTTSLVYHLPRDGYELGSNLPADPGAAAARWARLRAELAPRARMGVLLVQNGADHHALQRRHAEAIEALAMTARPDRVVESSLRRFAAAVVGAAARAEVPGLPEIAGELRDSYGYTWALQGTFATRARQKRANAQVERLLARDAEPWAALAALRGGRERGALLDAAWRTLLRCHPHDTLCGTSIDDVARAMDARLAAARAQGRGIRDDALLDVVGHDPVEARERPDEWRELAIVRNAAARPRGGVARLQLRRFLRHVPVGPGSAPAPGEPTEVAPPAAPLSLHLDGRPLHWQPLGRSLGHDRVESPRHYPDNDLVERIDALAWLPPVAGYGTASIELRAGTRDSGPPGPAGFRPVTAAGTAIENGILRMEVDGGVVRLTELASGRVVPSLIAFEDVGDRGDLYTPSLVGQPSRATLEGARLLRHGPLRGELETRWRIQVAPAPVRPAAAGEGAPPDSTPPVAMVVRARVSLDAEAPFVRLRVDGDNAATDHRLRVVVGTGVAGGAVLADAAFALVPRAPIRVAEEDRRVESPPPTAPLHRYVSRYAAGAGATVYSDGLAEYEALPDGGVAVTLVRAVGELSRRDLPERPGHAGWPVPTPGAQSRGRFAAELALLLHGGDTPATRALAERTADDVLLPLAGTPLRSALRIPPATAGLELEGETLAFSCAKPSADGRWLVLRARNLVGEPAIGRWRLAAPAGEAFRARLDESAEEPIPVVDGTVPFDVPPFGVVTILVR